MGFEDRQGQIPRRDGALWGTKTLVAYGGPVCPVDPSEIQGRGSSLKDLLALRSVPEGQESEAVVSREEQTGI